MPRRSDQPKTAHGLFDSVLTFAVAHYGRRHNNGGGIGSLTYMPAGSVVCWQAIAEVRLLIFHFPGGFDRALAGGRWKDALVVAWLESISTRFLTNMRLTPVALRGAA